MDTFLYFPKILYVIILWIISSPLYKINDLFIDILDRRIYWTIGNTIKSATFDGTGIKEVQRISHESSYYSINGIAVYNDYLYYSDNWSNYRYVYRVNKYGGTRQSIARLGSSVRDIKIFHGDSKSIKTHILKQTALAWFIDYL